SETRIYRNHNERICIGDLGSLQTAALAPEQHPAALAPFDAPAHLRHGVNWSQHRLPQVTLARGRCRQPIEVADRCAEGWEVRRIVDDVVGARRGDPRLLVLAG